MCLVNYSNTINKYFKDELRKKKVLIYLRETLNLNVKIDT